MCRLRSTKACRVRRSRSPANSLPAPSICAAPLVALWTRNWAFRAHVVWQRRRVEGAGTRPGSCRPERAVGGPQIWPRNRSRPRRAFRPPSRPAFRPGRSPPNCAPTRPRIVLRTASASRAEIAYPYSLPRPHRRPLRSLCSPLVPVSSHCLLLYMK